MRLTFSLNFSINFIGYWNEKIITENQLNFSPKLKLKFKRIFGKRKIRSPNDNRHCSKFSLYYCQTERQCWVRRIRFCGFSEFPEELLPQAHFENEKPMKNWNLWKPLCHKRSREESDWNEMTHLNSQQDPRAANSPFTNPPLLPSSNDENSSIHNPSRKDFPCWQWLLQCRMLTMIRGNETSEEFTEDWWTGIRNHDKSLENANRRIGKFSVPPTLKLTFEWSNSWFQIIASYVSR